MSYWGILYIYVFFWSYLTWEPESGVAMLFFFIILILISLIRQELFSVYTKQYCLIQLLELQRVELLTEFYSYIWEWISIMTFILKNFWKFILPFIFQYKFWLKFIYLKSLKTNVVLNLQNYIFFLTRSKLNSILFDSFRARFILSI